MPNSEADDYLLRQSEEHDISKPSTLRFVRSEDAGSISIDSEDDQSVTRSPRQLQLPDVDSRNPLFLPLDTPAPSFRLSYEDLPDARADDIPLQNLEQKSLAPEISQDVTRRAESKSVRKLLQAISSRCHEIIQPTTLFRAWWREFAVTMLASLSFCILFVLLAVYENGPVPHWPQELTINSAVAILITVIKSAMLFVLAECLGHLKWSWFTSQERSLRDMTVFDEASRGPKGAIELLWTLKNRNMPAFFGCILVILALAVDPFAQQLVLVTSCPIPPDPGSNTAATIPIANGFGFQSDDSTGTYSDLSQSLQLDVISSIFNLEPKIVPFSCTTGACTFDAHYHSLGYCSSCNNVSSELTQTIENSQYSLTLPSELTLSNKGGNNSYFIANFVDANDTRTCTFEAIYMVRGALQSNNELLRGYTGHPSCPECEWSGATRCQLHPCVVSYNANVSSATLTETMIERSGFQDWRAGNGSFSVLNLDCLAPESMLNATISKRFVGQEHWAFYDAAEDIVPDNQLDRCLYVLGGASQSSICGLLSFLLNNARIDESYVLKVPPNGFKPSNTAGFGAGSAQYPLLLKPFDASLDMTNARLYYFSTSTVRIKKIFDSVANMLTWRIRTSTPIDPSNGADLTRTSLINGKAWIASTCVQVRWAWLGYPLAFALMTIEFFVLTLLIAREFRPVKMHDWKSAPLPLMFPGLTSANVKESNARSMQTEMEMDIHSRRDRVRLVVGDKGWSFI